MATAGSPSWEEVTGYLNRILTGLGADAVGEAGASARMPGEMEAAGKEAFALGQYLVEAIKTKRSYPDQEALHREMRERFKALVEMNRDAWAHEYEHWKKMG